MISRIVFGGGFHKKKRKAVKKMQNRPYITFQVELILVVQFRKGHLLFDLKEGGCNASYKALNIDYLRSFRCLESSIVGFLSYSCFITNSPVPSSTTNFLLFS